jgi:hypothetical protein
MLLPFSLCPKYVRPSDLKAGEDAVTLTLKLPMTRYDTT